MRCCCWSTPNAAGSGRSGTSLTSGAPAGTAAAARRALLDALTAERFTPQPAELHGVEGPTSRWAQHVAVEEAWAHRKPFRPGYRVIHTPGDDAVEIEAV